MEEKFKVGFSKIRRKSTSHTSSSRSSSSSSCSDNSSSVTEECLHHDVDTAQIIDMAEIAKRRRQGRSKSVDFIRKIHCSSTDGTIDFTFKTKLDARSFQDLPTTTLCSTEL